MKMLVKRHGGTTGLLEIRSQKASGELSMHSMSHWCPNNQAITRNN